MDCQQLMSYSTAQSALMHPLLNNNLNLLPLKQQSTEPETQN